MMRCPDRLAASVKGFLDPLEGRRLFELAAAASRQGPCLEIGSYCGKSTVYLGCGCRQNGGVLFSVDHHRGSEEQQPGEAYFDPELFDSASGCVDTFPAFRRTLAAAGLEGTVVPLVCPSALAARGWATPLSLVFIDGGHSFEAAHGDYRAWTGHLMPGGYLLIHDIFLDPAAGGQAPREVYAIARASGRFDALPMTGTLGVLQRRA
ncbi:MAG: class I SAM-dependent methyltransferase [Desulfobacteraceae bacterium]|nr:class I SAM-dependent methyltransferase [Desulfobacteraceae bacterium]